MNEERLDLADSLEKAETLLSPWADTFTHPDDQRADAMLAAKDLHSAVATLVRESWGYLAAITGIDRPAAAEEDGLPQAENEIEVIYTFCWGAAVLSLHVRLGYSELVVDTVCDLIPSASFYERELMEMYGVVVENTPNTERLMLPDIWPEGVYPLRKSFSGLQDPNPRGS
ncbi:MAG: NADH-quinone oxidoreductase subunit C [Anaerolineaceae bacterium]|jgi:NADH:ubiquinone oxidoreductase subunit C|nr:NADH-quinone oxidoreductase subunit C [Anaerolineaceae bacterium]